MSTLGNTLMHAHTTVLYSFRQYLCCFAAEAAGLQHKQLVPGEFCMFTCSNTSTVSLHEE